MNENNIQTVHTIILYRTRKMNENNIQTVHTIILYRTRKMNENNIQTVHTIILYRTRKMNENNIQTVHTIILYRTRKMNENNVTIELRLNHGNLVPWKFEDRCGQFKSLRVYQSAWSGFKWGYFRIVFLIFYKIMVHNVY